MKGLESEFSEIPEDRAEVLIRIGEYIASSVRDRDSAELVFICTHNSRRSQFAQAWGMAAAEFYRIPGIRTYSGGLESTAFNPRAVAAIQRAGFTVERMPDESTTGSRIPADEANGENPRYRVSYGPAGRDIRMYSKKFDDPGNPREDFCAVMVCSHADEACPFVPGAAARISLSYDDPKAYDGTDLERLKYDERCREIARDLLYAFDHAVKR